METFGSMVRKLRKERKLSLQALSFETGIDTAILSKIERGQRKASRDMVEKLVAFFPAVSNELFIAWLSDRLVYQVVDEDFGLDAIQAAEAKVIYRKRKQLDIRFIIEAICDFLKKDGRVKKAWIFGSLARGEIQAGSDLDLMVSYSDKASGTLLDYADIRYRLEQVLNIRVDLVEEGYIKPFARESIERDKILIYGQ
ncbi:MAG: nucleotidyltransferase domain-containing protein [Bacteroidales bacterium]